MTAADWGLLVPAVVGLLTAIAAYLRANAAHRKIDSARLPPGPR
jgi:asparagine N-glycosylation enzyme membrane subunit Stt3